MSLHGVYRNQIAVYGLQQSGSRDTRWRWCRPPPVPPSGHRHILEGTEEQGLQLVGIIWRVYRSPKLYPDLTAIKVQ